MISVFLLLPLYFIAIQYERGGSWRWLKLFGFAALIIDVILNFTELAILTLDIPKKGEWTFSKRLTRLQYNTDWRGDFARYLSGCLNQIAPSGIHIKEQ
jgi:hypothetical protein